MKKSPNEFVYKATIKECEGKSSDWIKQAHNEVLATMTAQIESTDKAPEAEQLDRIESSLMALRDALYDRQHKTYCAGCCSNVTDFEASTCRNPNCGVPD